MKKSLLLLIVAACAFLVSPRAQAQTTKDYEKAVAEYLEVSNTQQTLYESIVQSYRAMNLPLTNVEEATNEILRTIWPDYIKSMAKIMQKYYSIDEMYSIIEFYKTPVGAKLAKFAPAVAQDASQIMLQSDMMDKIQNVLFKYISY